MSRSPVRSLFRIPAVKYTFLLLNKFFVTFRVIGIADYNIQRTNTDALGLVKETLTFSTQIRINNIDGTALINCVIGALFDTQAARHAFGANH